MGLISTEMFEIRLKHLYILLIAIAVFSGAYLAAAYSGSSSGGFKDIKIENTGKEDLQEAIKTGIKKKLGDKCPENHEASVDSEGNIDCEGKEDKVSSNFSLSKYLDYLRDTSKEL